MDFPISGFEFLILAFDFDFVFGIWNLKFEISRKDLLSVAEEYAIKNPKGIIEEITALTPKWLAIASNLKIPEKIINTINKDFIEL